MKYTFDMLSHVAMSSHLIRKYATAKYLGPTCMYV